MSLSQSKYHQSQSDISLEEKQLKEAVKDPKAFASIYQKYFLQIFRFTLQRVENEDIAADITSQVFSKALFKLKDYKFKGLPFSAWLFRVASNEVNMFFRARQAQRVVNVKTEDLGEIIQEMDDVGSEREEQLQAVIKVLRRLELDEVELVEMRFFEKRSFKEMGEILNINETNARVKTHRVIQKLKKLMKQ